MHTSFIGNAILEAPVCSDVLFYPPHNALVPGGVNYGLEHGGPPSVKRFWNALVLDTSFEHENFDSGTCGRFQNTLVLHWRNPLVLERISTAPGLNQAIRVTYVIVMT